MTTEERVFIEPPDIAFIESECPKCHTRTVVPFFGRERITDYRLPQG